MHGDSLGQVIDTLFGGPASLWVDAGLFLAILLVVLLVLRARRRRAAKERGRRPDTAAMPQAPVPEPQPGGEAGRRAGKELSAAETLSAQLSHRESTLQDLPVADTIGPETAARPYRMAKPPPGFLGRLKSGLAKTRANLSGSLEKLLGGKTRIDDELLEDLEELLITSDIGVETTLALIEKISLRSAELSCADDLKQALRQEILAMLTAQAPPVGNRASKPRVIMVVGVNGTGKTTTIGKLAARFTADNQKVLLAAADTFRAAAIEQLEVWAQRAGADIVKHRDGSDPAAVAFDSIEAARARDMDIVLIDTAGRLHTKVNLMEELKKIQRTIAKKLPGAPHDVLLVLDATTGQNALSQAKLFNQALGVTSIALTKLDGTAKGGIVIGICHELKIPLRYIGVGETIEDLQDFDPRAFTDALF